MRRFLLSLLIGFLCITSSQASASHSQDGRTTQAGNLDDKPLGRPKDARKNSSFYVSYFPGMGTLLITAVFDIGLVHAEFENLSSGTRYTISFDSSEPAILPTSGEPGIWRLILKPDAGAATSYVFYGF